MQVTFPARTRIVHHRCELRWSVCLSPRRAPKVLKPYTAFSIPVEVNDDLNAYLDNIADRKRLKRFSAASVRAWFLTRGYDKQ